jgi:hypothetical protein
VGGAGQEANGMTLPATDSPPVERQIARDMVRRALPIAPVILIAAAAGWGTAGALSAGYALILVLLNFLLAAAILGWAARTSLSLLMMAALGGYLLRLGLITGAVLAISGQSWFAPVPLGATIIITHLGLLLWELRYVSASLAFPGLKPQQKGS